jgi:predicted MFS family arabinose efflux permease
MGTAELGLWLGMIFGIGGIVGSVMGGAIANRWFPGDERGQMRVSAAASACLLPAYFAFLLLPDRHLSLVALALLMICASVFVGPTYALMQRLVPDGMRATTLSITMLFANLIGMGLAPQVVGIASDLLTPRFGSDSLRYAMLLVSFVALLVGYQFWRVGETVAADLKVARA